MCGIAGFTLQTPTPPESTRTTISHMLATSSYRGPDQCGIKILDQVAFGHNRLTIMEPNGGQQPRVNDRTNNCLIFNGEIYNHRSFNQDLVSSGAKLRDHCDTETLFWLIEFYGVSKTLNMIDGMFSFAHYRADDNTVILARDQFGQKPLFYAHIGKTLIFASEIKSIMRHPLLQTATPDISALSLYLMMEYIPGTATGIKQVHELPPGHILQFQDGNLFIEPYCNRKRVAQDSHIDKNTAAQELDYLLNTSVEQQLIADVPVGIFLSGGLDSSLIAGIASRQHANISTFTIKFPQSSYDESSHAQDVAKHLRTNHSTIELSRSNCVDGIADLISKTDQPFADSSLLPTYLLCKATKQHVKVALGGDGADELFFGYPNFKLQPFTPLFSSFPMFLRKAMEYFAQSQPLNKGYMNWAFLLRQLSYGLGKPSHMQSIYWMSALPAHEQKKLWHDNRDYEKAIYHEISSQFEHTESLSPIEQCQYHFLNCYLPYNILTKTDRASMYNSLEVRSPFLSSQVADFAFKLPTHLSFKKFKGKRVLKEVAKPYLPEKILNRKKHGFALPVSDLIRGDLRDVIEPILLNQSNPMYEFIHFEQVKNYWNQHILGLKDQGKTIWALLMLAAFFQNLF